MAEDDDDVRECIICCDRTCEVRYGPCGHAVACRVCTLTSIAHQQTATLQCPTCKQTIETVEEDRPDAELAIARQATFQLMRQASTAAFNPLSSIASGAVGASEATSSVNAFVKKYASSDDPELRKAAEAAASKRPAGANGIRRLLGQGPSIPIAGPIRVCCLALSVAMTAIFVSCVMRSHAASVEFARYLGSDHLSVLLTRLDGIAPPLNALLPSAGNGTAGWEAPLLLPTPFQRWWALVPADQGHGELIEDTADLLMARYYVFLLALYTGVQSCWSSLWAALTNKNNMIVSLSNTGFWLLTNVPILTALHALYWDEARQLVFCLYVPGWAYFYYYLWLFLTVLAAAAIVLAISRTGSLALQRWLLLPLGSFVYWLVWLALPFFVYTFLLAWNFVDAATAQDPADSAPFAAASASALRPPFAAGIYTGIAVFALCTFVLPRLNLRLLPPQPPQADAQQPDGAPAAAPEVQVEISEQSGLVQPEVQVPSTSAARPAAPAAAAAAAPDVERGLSMM